MLSREGRGCDQGLARQLLVCQALAEVVGRNVQRLRGDTTTDELRAGRSLALAGSLLTLILGMVASAAIVRGISDRRREFS